MCRKKKTNVSDTQEKCQTHNLSRCCDVSGCQSWRTSSLFFFRLLYVNQQVLEDILWAQSVWQQETGTKTGGKKKKGLCFGNCYPPLWAFFSTWCCICFHPFPQLCMERTVERVVLGGGGSFWGSWTLFTSQRESGVSTKQPKWAIVIGLLKCRSFYEGMWQWSACLDKKNLFRSFSFLSQDMSACDWCTW